MLLVKFWPGDASIAATFVTLSVIYLQTSWGWVETCPAAPSTAAPPSVPGEVTVPWAFVGTRSKQNRQDLGKTPAQCLVMGWGSGTYRENEPCDVYLKTLKNSLRLKRFEIGVSKYSSKTWKRSVKVGICWENMLAGTEGSYPYWQSLDYRQYLNNSL